MMAAVNIDELRELVGVPHAQVVRTVPLPSASTRTGPILCHPVLKVCVEVLEVVGTVVATEDEKEMLPLVCLTGHISSLYELMQVCIHMCILFLSLRGLKRLLLYVVGVILDTECFVMTPQSCSVM